jgi:nitroreductase
VKLNLSADQVLTTTRSVRKRLDFDRPVEREVIMECLDIALQAPTGSNSQGWHFVFVSDPAKKQIIADYYGRNFDEYTANSRVWPEGDLRAEQKPRVRDSAEYLREHFHRVPYMLIPVIEGELDKATTFAAILPAVWSFMLALRERGLGSAWTTLHLPNWREVGELLDIPTTHTQAGLFPIAYTLGTDFKPATRLDTESLVHFDTW